jgi:hypothetical protein
VASSTQRLESIRGKPARPNSNVNPVSNAIPLGVTRITIESVPAPIYTPNWVSGFTALADGTARAY